MGNILHMVCCLHSLKVYWLNYNHFSKGSKKRLKYVGTEKLNGNFQKII